MQHQLRKQLADAFKVNLKIHSEFTSDCCPIYSQRYEEWSQAISKYREASPFKRCVRTSLNNLLKLKQQIFPDEDDDICLSEMQVKPVVKSLTYNFTMEVNENQAYMANPEKKPKEHPKREDDELTVFESPIERPVVVKPVSQPEPPKK